jgi:hypothetical protein
MPNLSIYEQDAYGNDLPDYYHMLSTCSAELKKDQYKYVNPVALARQAKNDAPMDNNNYDNFNSRNNGQETDTL